MTDDPADLLGDLSQLRRKVRRDRSGATFPLLLFGMTALAAIGVYMITGYSALLVIVVAVLVLAWVERSVLVGAVGVLFTVVSVHANLQGIAHYLPVNFGDDGRAVVLADLALPAAVLIIGGVIALLTSRRAPE